MTVENRDPTPDELVDQLKRYHGKSPVKYDRVLRRVIKEAEGLGVAHQTAVSQYIAELAGVSPTKQVGAPWRPSYLDVHIEMVIRVDDQLFCVRETVDPFMWQMTFKDNAERWESFLSHFVRSAVGRMAQDPDQYAYFRRKLFVVTPDDRHNSRLCRASNDTGLNKNLSPQCFAGVVRTKRLTVGMFDAMVENPFLIQPNEALGSQALGKCMCRCHKHPLDQTDPEYYVGFHLPYDDRGTII